MAETYVLRKIAPVRATDRDIYVDYPLADSQDFEAGAPVVLSTGKISECGADPSSILGFATAGAADYAWMYSTRGDVVPQVPIALAGAEFRGSLKGTFAAADVGSKFGLVDDSGTWVVDRSETSNTRVVITGVDDGVEVGDINVPCTFVVLAANRQVI